MKKGHNNGPPEGEDGDCQYKVFKPKARG